MSILYKASPDDVKLMLIDPKKVELSIYNGIPHLLVPVISETKKAAGALSWAVGEMERRYGLLESVGVRDINTYNKVTKDDPDYAYMDRIVIIIDELADFMMTAPDAVEDSICRIAQKARAAGMHLILGTQRPSTNVITGLIKANIPSRIAFTVSNNTDSRVILDKGRRGKPHRKGRHAVQSRRRAQVVDVYRARLSPKPATSRKVHQEHERRLRDLFRIRG